MFVNDRNVKKAFTLLELVMGMSLVCLLVLSLFRFTGLQLKFFKTYQDKQTLFEMASITEDFMKRHLKRSRKISYVIDNNNTKKILEPNQWVHIRAIGFIIDYLNDDKKAFERENQYFYIYPKRNKLFLREHARTIPQNGLGIGAYEVATHIQSISILLQEDELHVHVELKQEQIEYQTDFIIPLPYLDE